MPVTVAAAYRRPMLDPGDALFLRCLGGSAIAAVVFVVLVRLVPAPPPTPVTQVEQLPTRFAKLILEPKRSTPPPPPLPAAEREAFMSRYKAAAGFAMETLNSSPAIIPPGARVRGD